MKKFFKKKLHQSENKKKKISYLATVISMKLFLIIFLIYGLYEYETPFSNDISLLAVSENDKGDIFAGSVIDLSLTVKPGKGNVFVKLNTIEELDTQISIINSNKIACSLFELDCNNYDFFYTFDSNSLVLKGPSASSAIAILTAKTMRREKINSKDVAITGSLNSGGLIGVVGGVDKKIETAALHGFKKVLVPAFASFNSSINYSGTEVIRSIDIVEAFNEFKGEKYKLKTIKGVNGEFDIAMKKLSDHMCARANDLELEVDYDKIEENSSNSRYLESGENAFNSSLIAGENGNFYSMGSYCYNINLNYRNILENQMNLSILDRDEKINSLLVKVDDKIKEFTTLGYKKNIQTINDFYVYLVLIHRIHESKELIKNALELEVDFSKYENPLNLSEEEISNMSVNNKSLSLIKTLNESQKLDIINGVKSQKEILYSYAVERFYTVGLWENFIDHSGGNVFFTDTQISDVCSKINREISIKSELLKSYNLNIFDELISEQLKLNLPGKNQYLCIYKGLELDGRINTILNSVGVTSDNDDEFISKLIELTNTRIHLNSGGEFPLIPTIYSEYSQDLIAGGDVTSGILYSNYALSYANLNIYLEQEEPEVSVLDATLDKLFENILFVITVMIVIAFLN